MAKDTKDEANAIAKSMGNLKIQTVRTDQVTPYDNNPRKIGPEAVAKVAGSIRKYGFNVPISVDEDMVILTGHTRLQAAKHLGLKVVPIVVIAGLTEAQKREYRIADNRVAEESKWDTGKLEDELEALHKMGADLLGTGFGADELAKMVEGFELEVAAEEPAAAAPAEAAAAKVDRKPVSDDKNPTSVIDVGGDYVKLCELVMSWYSPPGSVILSPFAGVEGCAAAAAKLGRELHDTPIDSLPRVVLGDLLFGVPAPPAGDFPAWCAEYARVLELAAGRLKPGSFAVILIGDARNADGTCYGLPWLSVEYAMRAGLGLHDSAVVLLTPGPADDFGASRRLAPAHAHLLVFRKA